MFSITTMHVAKENSDVIRLKLISFFGCILFLKTKTTVKILDLHLLKRRLSTQIIRIVCSVSMFWSRDYVDLHLQNLRTNLPADCIDIPLRKAVRKQWGRIGTLISWPYNSFKYLGYKIIPDGSYIYINFSLTCFFIFIN